ncbi:MAG: hypothetical protein ACLT1I_12765 [Mediterraneibacter faecis]
MNQIKTSEIYVVLKNELVDDKAEINVKKMRFEISTKGKLWNALKPEQFSTNMEFVRKEGVRAFVEKIKKEINPQYSNYDAWIRTKALSGKSEKRAEN